MRRQSSSFSLHSSFLLVWFYGMAVALLFLAQLRHLAEYHTPRHGRDGSKNSEISPRSVQEAHREELVSIISSLRNFQQEQQLRSRYGHDDITMPAPIFWDNSLDDDGDENNNSNESDDGSVDSHSNKDLNLPKQDDDINSNSGEEKERRFEEDENNNNKASFRRRIPGIYKFDPFDLKEYEGLVPEQQQQRSPLPPPTGSSSDISCSCYNETAPWSCCERYIHATHKMGHTYIKDLFGPYSAYNPGDRILRTPARADHRWDGTHGFRPIDGIEDIAPGSGYFDRAADYREVFVNRNWFESLVSGYLYRKAGHECWMGDHGERLRHSEEGEDIGKEVTKRLVRLEHSSPWGQPPPFEGRSICRYLADESELHGMRVWIEFVTRVYYRPMVQILQQVQKREDSGHRKTLFVCYEDLYYPERRAATLGRILEWFYPGQQQDQQPNSLPIPPGVFQEYNGNHATTKDPELRNRLRALAELLDRDVFDGVIHKFQTLFGNCGDDRYPTDAIHAAMAQFDEQQQVLRR